MTWQDMAEAYAIFRFSDYREANYMMLLCNLYTRVKHNLNKKEKELIIVLGKSQNKDNHLIAEQILLTKQNEEIF